MNNKKLVTLSAIKEDTIDKDPSVFLRLFHEMTALPESISDFIGGAGEIEGLPGDKLTFEILEGGGSNEVSLKHGDEFYDLFHPGSLEIDEVLRLFRTSHGMVEIYKIRILKQMMRPRSWGK